MIKNYGIKTNSVEIRCKYDESKKIITILNNGIVYYKNKYYPVIANMVTITDVKEVLYNELSYYVIRIITSDNKLITISRYGDVKL